MILDNWLRRYRAHSPLCRFHPQSWNRICNVLEGIEGVGCRIQKTENGHGWLIIVGDGSDTTLPEGFPSGGAGLPYGGEEYQVLQRDGDGAAIWDWVRYVVPL